MSFNADAFAAAHVPWTVTLRGDVFTAREPSAEFVLSWTAQVQAAASDAHAQRALVRRFWRTLFPWKPVYLWRGDPVARLLAQPLGVEEALLQDFFARERRIPSLPNSMSGPSSAPNSRTPTPSRNPTAVR